jgi:uncharacterized membrane protein (UPF0127 family)
MRETRIPLTVGFFDKAGRLFEIVDMQPDTDNLHFSTRPAAAALELEQGQFQAHGLAEGVMLIKRKC